MRVAATLRAPKANLTFDHKRHLDRGVKLARPATAT
jgi:hypothetical protein